MRRALALAIAFGFCAVANAQIEWILWEPMAVRADRTEPVHMEMQLDTSGRIPGGNAPAARLDLAGGGSLTLTAMGSGRFSATVAAAQLLHDYKADDSTATSSDSSVCSMRAMLSWPPTTLSSTSSTRTFRP